MGMNHWMLHHSMCQNGASFCRRLPYDASAGSIDDGHLEKRVKRIALLATGDFHSLAMRILGQPHMLKVFRWSSNRLPILDKNQSTREKNWILM